MAADAPADEAGTTPATNPPTRAARRRAPRAEEDPDAPPNPTKPRPLTGRAKTDKAIEDYIARLVADAPPLSPEQRRRIAELFAYVSPQ